MTTPRILVIDAPGPSRTACEQLLADRGFEVACADDPNKAFAELAQFKPDVVLMDIQLPDTDGFELFNQVRGRHPGLPTLIVTADQTVPRAIEATQKGAFAYLPKPVEDEVLLGKIHSALTQGSAPRAGLALATLDDWRKELVTCSAVMNQLMQEAMQVARSESSVLILGKSGTGKELLAQVMHKASQRAGGPFVGVNCTAIPESLFESELFGHIKGSFTGANQDREGLMAAAQGGSLMLDEVGDMPLAFQAKLLRVLQEREFRPVGATSTVPLDVRVISATHHDLDAEVDAGTFRDDLFYRLNVVTLEMPSLADRREDIQLLATHFLKELTENREPGNQPISGFADDAMERLVTSRWPGNIRQLQNVVEQCVVLSTAPMISDQLVKRALRSKTEPLQSFSSARNQFEFQYLLNLLHTTQGNVTQAAKLAQRNRSEFYKLLRKHHLVPESFREDQE